MNGFDLFWFKTGVFTIAFFFVYSSKFVLRCNIRRLAGGGREQFSLLIETCLAGLIAFSKIPLGFFSSAPRLTELTVGICKVVDGNEPYLGTELIIPPIPPPGVSSLTRV